MANRNYYSASQVTQSSTNSTTPVDFLTLQFTPEVGKYAIIATWDQSGSASGTIYKSRFILAGSPDTVLFEDVRWMMDSYDNGDYHPCGGISIQEYTGTPSQQTFKIQYYSNSVSFYCYLKNAHIVAIKLTSNDKDVASLGESSTSSTAWTAKLTNTFTPASQGWYGIICSCRLYNDAGGTHPQARLRVDSSDTYAYASLKPFNTTERHLYMAVLAVELTAAEHNIYLEFSSEIDTYTIQIDAASMVAFRLSDFPGYDYVSDQSRSSTNSDSYQNKLTSSESYINGIDYVLLASAGYDGSTYNDYYSQVKIELDNTTILTEAHAEMSETYANNQEGCGVCLVYPFTGAGASKQFDLDYRSENSGHYCGLKCANFLILQLEEANIIIAPEAAVVIAGAENPVVIGGSITLQPEPAEVNLSALDPTLFFSQISVAPDPAAIIAVAVDPRIRLLTITVPPPSWPNTLPSEFDVNSFSVEHHSDFVRSQVDSGLAKRRRRFTKGVSTISGKMTFTYEQLNDLWDFWEEDLDGGVNQFLFPRPGYSSGNILVAFKETFAYEHKGASLFVVKVILETLEHYCA